MDRRVVRYIQSEYPDIDIHNIPQNLYAMISNLIKDKRLPRKRYNIFMNEYSSLESTNYFEMFRLFEEDFWTGLHFPDPDSVFCLVYTMMVRSPSDIVVARTRAFDLQVHSDINRVKNECNKLIDNLLEEEDYYELSLDIEQYDFVYCKLIVKSFYAQE